MNLLTNYVPTWVSVLFIISFMAPIFLIRNAVKEGTNQLILEEIKRKRLINGTFIFLICYYLYVALMSMTGIFKVNVLPPRILVFTALPLLLFYFLIIFRAKLFWKLLEKISLTTLVRLHVFRFVGVFFIIAWAYKALPTYFALSAGIGDIFAAVTGLIAIQFIRNKHKHYKTITLIWNIIGFWDIMNVLVSAIIITKQSLENGTQGVVAMADFPFALIPAFAPATIVFLHIAIFKKLKMEK
jgi:hypothetical protein